MLMFDRQNFPKAQARQCRHSTGPDAIKLRGCRTAAAFKL